MNRKRIALAGLALLATTGCTPTIDTVLIGDSIMAQIKTTVEGVLPGNEKTDADPGREVDTHDIAGHTDTHRAALLRNLPVINQAERLVIQDDGGQSTYESYSQWVVDVSLVVDDAVCITWVTPYDIWKPDTTAEVRAAIYDHAATQPCYDIAPWGETIMGEPATFLADGLHVNRLGQDTLTHLIWYAGQ